MDALLDLETNVNGGAAQMQPARQFSPPACFADSIGKGIVRSVCFQESGPGIFTSPQDEFVPDRNAD